MEQRSAENGGKGRCLRPAVILAVLATAATLAGCNTVKGVGRDVKAAGQVIERTAERHRGY